MTEEQNRTLQDKFMLRLPDGMRDDLKQAADISGRSMNSEIVQRLKQSFSERDDDRLKLDLPPEVRSALLTDGYAHGVDEEERAVQILTGAYDRESDYTGMLDRLYEEIGRRADLEDRNDALKQLLERDFVLYYGKVIQLDQFVTLLMASADNLPEHIRKAALQLDALNKTELATLRQRYEDGLSWIKQRDLERKNAEDAAAEGGDTGE